MKSSQEIRDAFTKFFQKKGHTSLPSSPVLPHDDPTLLFVNAGMNQFKDIFLGKRAPLHPKVVTVQKCIRVGGKHNDLENVGHTTRHLTFFEMCGNFTFGDYFKKEAIDFAFEFFQVLELDVERLFATVFHEDEQSFELWKRYLPEKRICRMGEKDNFWAMGATGPCGPCSELLYDRGSEFSNARSPAEDIEGERFFEFWNLVFMQYERDLSGKTTPLPKGCVDTGAGLERLVMLKMGQKSLFDTDVLGSLIRGVERLSKKKYNKENKDEAAPFRVIADHLRTLLFAISDGVEPSNTERGYVLRKVLRRALRYGRMLGLEQPFLSELVPDLVSLMKISYPEILASEKRAQEILYREEESFLRTLKRGGGLLTQIIANSEKSNHQISGEDAFKLKDTYGLPLEEILLLAKDSHLTVDLARFEELTVEAKERSKKAHKTESQLVDKSNLSSIVKAKGESQFMGYEQLNCEATIIGLMKGQEEVDLLWPGEEGLILLDRTPFYAEMGGQVGDQGILLSDELTFQVIDCKTPYPGLIMHHGVVVSGKASVQQRVSAQVDNKRRISIQNNHTATHLLHWALEQVLGGHIKQAGSVVEAHKLRFDFSHHHGLTQEQIDQIENLVCEKICSDLPVRSYELTYDQVQKMKEIKQFFGEKYGQKVRVVDIDFSKELCGGTHTLRLGTIGAFRILKESSIAAGTRRIEAVTGQDALEYSRELEKELKKSANILKCTPEQLFEKVGVLLQEKRELEKQLAQRQKELLQIEVLALLTKIQEKAGVCTLFEEVEIEHERIKELADLIMARQKSLVLLLVSQKEGKCLLVARCSKDYVQKNFQAQELIKELSPLIGAKGGGRQDAAQASAAQTDKIKELFQKADQWIQVTGKKSS